MSLVIPNDILEYVVLPLTPEVFLSTNRRFNDLARVRISHGVGVDPSKYINRIVIRDPALVSTLGSFPNQILGTIIVITQNIEPIIAAIYTHDSCNCLTALIELGVDIKRYPDEAVLTYRSFECLKIMLVLNKQKYAMLVYMYALRYDDVELCELVTTYAGLTLTQGKLYAALVDRRLNCYRWILSKGIIPSNDVFEYLISQDLHEILDETLSLGICNEFKSNVLNTLYFHEFVAKSANVTTARVLLKHKFDPCRYNKIVVLIASDYNMATAIVFSNACDNSDNSIKK
jgi:hypothetical protein